MTELTKVQQGESLNSPGDRLEVSKYDYKERLKNLNEAQKKAVFHSLGPCLVNAVPGSGKTMALTMRFVRLVNNGVPPKRILCCTFTKKAALEMKGRIVAGVKDGDHFYAPFIGTMHSLFYKMLHSHPDFYMTSRIPVATRHFSRAKYIIEAAKKFGDNIKDIDFKTIFGEISKAKNDLLDADELKKKIISDTGLKAYPAGPGCLDVWDYYRVYEELKKKDGMIDFDDMVFKTWQMFTLYPDTLIKWQNYFDYVMIDEFQDINKAQWVVIKMLAVRHKNVFMVGDCNQSIYGFRGSRPEFLYNIKKEFPNVKIMHMAKNYRSGDEIIRVANSVAKNTKYFTTEIEGTGKSATVEYALFETEKAQAEGITSRIKLFLENGVDPDEIGVIFRTNECAGFIELKLAKEDIKFKSPKGDGFFGSKIVKDCLAYLSASLTDNCESDLSRIINVPNRYLGAAFKAEWVANMELNACLPKNALLLEYAHDYWKRNASELYFHLEKIKTFYSDAKEAIKYIREGVGYEEWLFKESSDLDMAKTDMLEELEYVAAYSGTVPKLLESVIEIKNHEALESAVTLMTIHGSKGLEFEHVFFSSLIEGIIPHKRAESEEAIHEERRMFFVGITRAKKGLYLSSFGDSKGQGEKNEDGSNRYQAKPSEFLNECGI